MKNLSKSIVYLTVYILFYLSIDRLNQLNVNFINLQPLLHLLIISLVFISILFPIFRKISITSSIIIWDIIYFLLWILSTQKSIKEFGTFLLPITLELVLFSLLIYYTKRVAQHITDLELLIQYVILPKTNHNIYDTHTAEPIIENELIRSRRYNYPVSALILKPNPNVGKYPTPDELERSAKEILDLLKTRYTISKMAEVIGNQTRCIDLIIRQDQENNFLLLCPEISTQNAALLAERLEKITKEELGVSLVTGIATFPQDGPSLQAILEKAASQLPEMIPETKNSP